MVEQARRLGLSVVVPTRDRPDSLEECLQSLGAALSDFDQLIVVDSASTTTGLPAIAKAHDALYVRCEEPGASKARNAGWRAAKHDIIAFIDDDVRVEAGWADGVALCFERFPDASFVSGRLDTPRGSDSGREHESSDELADELYRRARDLADARAPFLLHEDPCWIDDEFDEDVGHSANLALRRAVLTDLGGFDEQLGAGAKFRAAEDKDIFDRLFSAGLRGRYEPTAAALHLDWRDRRDTLALNWTYGIGLGARIVKRAKTDRQRAKRVARETLWVWGLLEVYRNLTNRNKWMVLITSVRTLGMIAGLVRAASHRVESGHFVTPQKRTPSRARS
jgi:glycosyltransferase involved in cell wall biosynthesis